MAILDELNDALKEAMKTKEKAKLDAIRQVKSEINEHWIDLSSEAKLTFSDGSLAYLSSSIKENLDNSVEVTNGKRTLLVRDPWHCGEYKKDNNSLIIKEGNKKISEINIDAMGKIYINEINHFDEKLRTL